MDGSRVSQAFLHAERYKMNNLLKNELLKLKRSKSVKVLFWYFVIYSILGTLFFHRADAGSFERSGFSAPFLTFAMHGSSGFFFYASVAAGLVANEFSQGTIHNAISCGVERRRYFLSKICCLLGVTVFLYLTNVLVRSLAQSIFSSFDPYGILYSRYWQKVLVYNLAAILLLLSSMSLFICIAYLCRRGVMTFVISLLATDADLIWYSRISRDKPVGPVSVMWQMLDMAGTDSSSDRLLEPGFLLLLLPSLCMGAISLIVAYQLFKRADIN